jgi:hypothetical protein
MDMHPDDEIRAMAIVTIRNALDSLFIVFSSYRKVAIDDN